MQKWNTVKFPAQHVSIILSWFRSVLFSSVLLFCLTIVPAVQRWCCHNSYSLSMTSSVLFSLCGLWASPFPFCRSLIWPLIAAFSGHFFFSLPFFTLCFLDRSWSFERNRHLFLLSEVTMCLVVFDKASA